MPPEIEPLTVGTRSKNSAAKLTGWLIINFTLIMHVLVKNGVLTMFIEVDCLT